MYKSENNVILLALLPGLIGFSGIGHLYLGKIERGIVICVFAFILFVAGLATLFFGFGAVLLIACFVLFVWSVVDARNKCREYNEHVRTHGAPPY